MATSNNNFGPYSIGFNTVTHRNAQVRTVFNAVQFDNLLENLQTDYTYTEGYVPIGFEHRPDLISQAFYGTPKNWWLLMVANNINDPFEGFNVGDKILIPNIE